MTVDALEPRLSLLSEEYVLVQAWKKAAAYIRAHNWYSDTLELDHAAVNLPQFVGDLAVRFQNHAQWRNDELRIVPAPKSQQWYVDRASGTWLPRPSKVAKSVLRPLAHVSLRDQVAATAILLCLADRVESVQGDPKADAREAGTRRRVTSYGNRLFCDAQSHVLKHRWGATKLYRAYYQDYRAFLARPEIVAANVSDDATTKIVVVHSDLRQFYDRVSPELMALKLAALWVPGDDISFFDLAAQVLTWGWHERDGKEAAAYAAGAGLEQFTRVALPQGLVAAGFFANIALLDFDASARAATSTEIAADISLLDCCRYVDDLRLVLRVPRSLSLADVERTCFGWIQTLLDKQAPGLLVSEEKTTAAALHGDERPLVRQSRKLQRIQTAVSGGFDAIGGEEILDAVQGLIRSQQRYSEQREEDGWTMAPVADVRDATVARFAAQRFRTTYRSLRSLLAERTPPRPGDGADVDDDAPDRSRVARTQEDLDDEARAFALGLVENWIQDPSNVRLLRVGLDLWPAVDLLRSILGVLRPFTEKGGKRKVPRRVAWYCLAEIFRAAATETGFVEDHESLPVGIDIAAYREELVNEAVRLCALPAATLPWYLRQQALLYLAAAAPDRAPLVRAGRSAETKRYTELIRYLRGDGERMTGVEFATLAILARRAFAGRAKGVALALPTLTSRRLEQIAERDPSFALELIEARPEQAAQVSPRLRDDLCLARPAETDDEAALAAIVLKTRSHNRLRDELSLLSFAARFLDALPPGYEDAVTPSEVLLRLPDSQQRGKVESVRLAPSRVATGGSMYRPPAWCPAEDRWRFQLGFLLRFILAGREDFTKTVRSPSWKEDRQIYRVPDSHWYQRLYGAFSGQSAFGDDWLPISDWVEELLAALLEWPGCRAGRATFVAEGVQSARAAINARIADLEVGSASGALLLRLPARRLVSTEATRPLRACVVQNVVPEPADFLPADLTLSNPQMRKRHRNHLAAVLAAVDRMLDVRETHRGRNGRLDWLILPELSVHPRDIRSHLVPFARAHKTIIFAGVAYQHLVPGGPLINSAMWIIPQWTATHGLQMLIRRQGKQHLAPEEQRLNQGAGPQIAGFRPCQWLVGYEWSKRAGHEPLWLTGSVCYDATDLALAADLRSRSDVFAISALNKDVTTFDQMAFALHYHMYQLVIVANNGAFGGSNAHAPYRDAYTRQVFHVHGQPQASVSFLEIDDVNAFLQRKVAGSALSTPQGAKSDWKFPPAGL